VPTWGRRFRPALPPANYLYQSDILATSECHANFAVLSAAFLIGIAAAQQTTANSNVVIRSSTREVLLEVAVRDPHGRLVKKIDPEQVTVYEDGVRQEIRSFRLVQGREVRAEDEKQAAQTAAVQPVYPYMDAGVGTNRTLATPSFYVRF
jgi:hypothetical protein